MNLAPILMLVLSLLATGDGKRPPWLRTFGGGVASRMAAPSHDVYYIRTGDTLYVRGAISATKHIAQLYSHRSETNNLMEWRGAFVISPSAPYTLAGMRQGQYIQSGGDDHAPISTAHNIGYLSGNHGLNSPVVRSDTDIDATDIGSRWYDATSYFWLAKVGAAGAGTVDTLTFYSEPYAYSTYWLMRTGVTASPQKLGHVSGGTHTDSITITAQTATQQYPVVTDISYSYLRNGLTAIADGESGYAAYVDVVESYNIVNPSTMDTAQVASPWAWNDCDSTWVEVSNTYRATGGLTMIHTTYNLRQPMAISYVGFVQQSNATSAAHANRWLYVPRLKDSSKFTYRNLWNSAANTGFYPDSMRVAGQYINRQMTMWQATGDTMDIAQAMGLVMARHGADANRYCSASGSYSIWSLSSDGKCYAKQSSGLGATAARTWDVFAYRQWVDCKAYWKDKTAYWHAAADTDYVYIDYHDAVTNDATVVPSRMWGKTITVLDTLNVYNISATVPQTGILVSTTGSDTLGYAVLRVN